MIRVIELSTFFERCSMQFWTLVPKLDLPLFWYLVKTTQFAKESEPITVSKFLNTERKSSGFDFLLSSFTRKLLLRLVFWSRTSLNSMTLSVFCEKT